MFRYPGDGLCLLAQALYAVNRWMIKPVAARGFFHSHFNDLLLIPAALPWVLWLHRRLGWRQHDQMPTGPEIVAHTLLWSLICEAVGPWLFHRGTADIWDVGAYAAGAGVAWCWWARPWRESRHK